MIGSLLLMPETVRPALRNTQSSLQWSATTSLHNDSLWLRRAQKKLRELATLPENWDSYGSHPIQPAAIEKASELISLLSDLKTAQPEIFPVAGGGLQLELRDRQHEIEIEILPDGNIEYLILDENRQMREGSVPADSMGEVYRLIHWFRKEPSKAVEF